MRKPWADFRLRHLSWPIRRGSASKSGATAATSSTATAKTANSSAPPVNPAVTGKGVLDFIPMWDSTSDIVDSIMFQKKFTDRHQHHGTGGDARCQRQDDVRDTLTLFPKSTDNTGDQRNVVQDRFHGQGHVHLGSDVPWYGHDHRRDHGERQRTVRRGHDWTLSLKVPAAGITNAMLQNSKVTLNASTAGGLTVPGAMTLGSTYTIGLKDVRREPGPAI